jgi:sugar lactone lactonase YvrE
MRYASLALAIAAFLAAAAGAAQEPQLNGPAGLCYDDAGRLYVADTQNHRVLVFSPELKLLRAIGAEGTGPGQFRLPADVAVDGAGRIIVVEQGNHRVQVLSGDGKPLRTIGGPKEGTQDGQFRSPSKVAVDENGHILISDTHNHRLQVFDREGKHVFTLANRTGPMPMALIKPGKDGTKKPKDWERTDPGQLNEPGGIFYDRKLRRLFLANGWNCRAEVLDYDPDSGVISRRPEETGIVWGWWVTKGIAGDGRGRLIGCDTGFGSLNVFENRAALTHKSQKALTLDGGPYGKLREVLDVAVGPNGDIAVTDTGHNRIVLFPAEMKLPGSPRVKRIGRTGAVVTWQTLRPARSQAMLRQGDFPVGTPGREDPWSAAEIRTATGGGAPATRHELEITPLRPGTRYYYRLNSPSLRSIPGAGHTREYAFATLPPAGKTTFVRIPVKALLLPNIVDLGGVAAETALPEPMPAAEIDLYRRELAEVQLFYWCNSSMKYWMDVHFYVDQTMYRTGPDRQDAPEAFARLPRANHDQSLRRLIDQAGRGREVYVGQVICEATRRWDAARKAWDYQGSGGGTYGVEWPTPGRSHFLGGSDVAWLMCHEYKHQFESQYHNSGLDAEDDRSIFCHFSPQYPGWPWCTAYDHGEHWDGIAWQLRHFTAFQYYRNLYGEIVSSADADDDGIPDDDPRVPLDEKRFGSSPKRRDTDGDGLDDMGEVLASRWVRCLNTPLRIKVPGKWARPDPTNKDSDGDGVPDGKDPYPIYPFRPVIRRGTVRVDGDLGDWPEKCDYWLDHAGVKLQGWACWDGEYLYYAFALRGGWRKVTLVVDQDADGFYVGGDNVYAEFLPDAPRGPRKANVRMHYCNLGRWPWFDDKHEFVKPEAYPFASVRRGDADVFELALPRNEMCGLSLQAGEQVGMALYVGIPDKGAISLFEPWNIFDSVLAK